MDERIITDAAVTEDGSQSSPKTLWNEGRVVGYSAYEVYVRQHLLEDPNTPPASEREWLAASLGTGASILVRIDPTRGIKSTQHHKMDIPLPVNTQICAANSIVASLFFGEGGCDDTNKKFATYVKSYGHLLANTSTSCPSDSVPSEDVSKIPSDMSMRTYWTKEELQTIRDYLRIQDGIVIHPGKWTRSKKDDPYKDFAPQLAAELGQSIYPTIRLSIKGPIESSFWILLTGFTMRSIVSGESKYDTGCIITDNPQNGDFLGPEVFPWANKIIFSIPSAVMRYDGLYTRTIDDGLPLQVQDTAIIDMRDSELHTYYGSYHTDASIPVYVSEDFVSLKDGAAILTVYQRDPELPPALYGTHIWNSDEAPSSQALYPIDTVAPRTIKLFTSTEVETAKEFENCVPYNYALIRRQKDYVLQQLKGKDVIPVAQGSVEKGGTADRPIYTQKHEYGNKTYFTISLLDAAEKALSLDGEAGGLWELQDDKLTWQTLLEALGSNAAIDVLGADLRAFKEAIISLIDGHHTNVQYAIQFVNQGEEIVLQLTPLANSVGAIVEKRESGIYEVVISQSGSDARKGIKAVALTDNEGKELALDGNGGTIDNDGNKLDLDRNRGTALNWDTLLKALANNQKIELVNAAIRSLGESITKTGETDSGQQESYTIGFDAEGNACLKTLEQAQIPKFPGYVLKSIPLTITTDSDDNSFAEKMKLDVFGYVNSDDPSFQTINMFCTLTMTKGDKQMNGGAGAYTWWQPFKITGANNISAWGDVCDMLRRSSIYPEGAKKIIFTCGGRPIYNTYNQYGNDYYKYCIPSYLLSVVAYIKPVYYNEDNGTWYIEGEVDSEGKPIAVTDHNLDGVLIVRDRHLGMGWKGSPSAAAFTGSLTGDTEGQSWPTSPGTL